MNGLVVRDLVVSYRKAPVLHDVDLDVAAGSITGVVGPNGAGKSTLLKAVIGLVRPSAGTVTLEGQPVSRARARVAYLPQRSTIDWDYPAQVQDVVGMGRYPHLGVLGRSRPRDRALVAEALDRVGLTGLRKRQIGELSGGQQQRVFLARALAQEASWLFLDEPFSGVDTPTITLLAGILRELSSDGAGIVVVNHDLSVLEDFADRVLLLNRTVVAEGPTSSVLTTTTLARAYGVTPERLPVRLVAGG